MSLHRLSHGAAVQLCGALSVAASLSEDYLYRWLFALYVMDCRECFRKMLFVLLSVAVGCIAVTQSGFNLQLSRWCGDPLRAAFLSTLIGVAELYGGMLFLIYFRSSDDFSVSALRANLRTIKTEVVLSSHSMYLNVLIWPGILGVIWLSTAIVLTPVLGFGLYFISCISGQIVSSVVIDHFGLFWSDIRTLSIPNALGVVLAMVGIFIFSIEVVLEEYDGENSNDIVVIVACSALSVFVGSCLTVQSSLNGKLKLLMKGTAYVVTLISFSSSIVVLFVVSILSYCLKWDWFVFDAEALEWYIFNGGFLGPFIVGIYVICPQYIGFSGTFIAGILGYLGSSVLFDQFGVFGVEPTPVTVWKALGVLSVFVASVLINV